MDKEIRQFYQRAEDVHGCGQVEEITRLKTNEKHILESLERMEKSSERVADALEKLARQDERVSRLETDVDTLYGRVRAIEIHPAKYLDYAINAGVTAVIVLVVRFLFK